MMKESVEEFHGDSLIDEMGASTFAVESLLGILTDLSDDELSGYIGRLADLAQRDLSEKNAALVCLIEEFIGEIKIEKGLWSGNAIASVKRIRFRPCLKLVAAIRKTISENPDFTIEVPGGWGAYCANKKGASSLGGNDTEAPSAQKPG